MQTVPSTLELTYRDILARIPRDDIQVAKQTLLWLSFSRRPLSFRNLCEAAIIRENDIAIDEDMRLLRPESLLRMCSSLISYNNVTTRVTLAHSSVREYLTSQEIQTSNVREFYLIEARADNTICRLCLYFLCLPVFSSGYCPSDAMLSRRFDEWPLLGYISDILFVHLSHVILDETIKALLLRFFATQKQPRRGNFGAWVQAFTPHATRANIESSTPLYYAARFGLLPLVKIILFIEGTKNLNVPGGVHGSTPLHVAAWQGRTDVVRELLKAGADAREVNQDGKTGLGWAVKYGFVEIEQMLRNAGASLDGLIDSDENIALVRQNWVDTTSKTKCPRGTSSQWRRIKSK